MTLRHSKLQNSAMQPRTHWPVVATIDAHPADIHIALTIAENLAHDNGARHRSIALARVVIDSAGHTSTVTFTAGPAKDQAEAVDTLRNHLGQAARDLTERNWGTYTHLLQMLSAAAT